LPGRGPAEGGVLGGEETHWTDELAVAMHAGGRGRLAAGAGGALGRAVRGDDRRSVDPAPCARLERDVPRAGGAQNPPVSEMEAIGFTDFPEAGPWVISGAGR